MICARRCSLFSLLIFSTIFSLRMCSTCGFCLTGKTSLEIVGDRKRRMGVGYDRKGEIETTDTLITYPAFRQQNRLHGPKCGSHRNFARLELTRRTKEAARL